MSFAGIDFGSHMVKAAIVESYRSRPSVIPLGEEDPFFPCAIAVTPEGGFGRAGWPAYRTRFRDRSVVCAFRDRLADPDARISAMDVEVNRERLLAVFLQSLGERLAAGGYEITTVAVSVPDDWKHARWFYAVAQKDAGWLPGLVVREWQAVASLQSNLSGEHAVFASLGAAGTGMTLCQQQDGFWFPLASVRSESLSAQALKRRYLSNLAEEVIQEVRLDPREDAEANAALQATVDRLFLDLVHQGRGGAEVELMGRRVTRSVELPQIASMADSFRKELQRDLEHLLNEHKVEQARVYLWGELSLLLPVQQWLADHPLVHGEPKLASLDVVAAGTARLCASVTELGLLDNAELFHSVSTQDGSYAENYTPSADDSTPVLHFLPASLTESKPARSGQLHLLDPDVRGTDSVKTIERQLLLGRGPESGWVFGSEKYPEVSFEHCVFLCSGDKFVLKDMDSTNGTYVNGERVSIHTLNDNDEIQLGKRGPRFRFKFAK